MRTNLNNKDMNTTVTSVNRQIVLRDTPNGMPVRTRFKAGFVIKMVTA
jgi:hypothetical protein